MRVAATADFNRRKIREGRIGRRRRDDVRGGSQGKERRVETSRCPRTRFLFVNI